MSLQAAAIISTGTPPGVGMGQRPPVYLKARDTIQLGIERLGVQQQQVVADSLADSQYFAHSKEIR
jgi:2-keto-4-pentenoate hydratase/2-oxohepta-3-ene-1,7-dioic acid hydratase in catechol pathway